MSNSTQTGRKLKAPERAIILALAPSITAFLDAASVVDMRDGGMGSIRFVGESNRRRSRALAEAQYLDEDGVFVSIELNVDQHNNPFELDFWKADFSSLRRYPEPHDLRSAK